MLTFLANALLPLALLGAQSTQFQGVIDAVTCDAIGRTDGVVLRDHTFVVIRPAALEFGAELTPGQAITIKGTQVLASPNRVFARVSIKQDDKVLVEDLAVVSAADGAGKSRGDQADSKFVFRSSASVSAIGISVDSVKHALDRLVLDGGQSVLIPSHAAIDVTKIKIGSVVSVVGAATAASQGRVAVAMSVQDHAGVELLKPLTSKSGGEWSLTQGVIKQLQTNAKGDVEGFLLVDGRTVKFTKPMVSYGDATRFMPFQSVEVGGPASGGEKKKTITTDLVILLGQNAVIDTANEVIARRRR